LQELIQNADDAGATEVKFLLDDTHYSTDRLFSDEMDQYQVLIHFKSGREWQKLVMAFCYSEN
jgi:hypothetical protein